MKKKFIPTMITTLSIALVVGVLVAKNYSGILFGVSANDTYTLEFTSTKNTLSSDTSTSTVYTTSGYGLTFSHSGVSNADDTWAVLSTDGYVTNTDAIRGMSSITIERSDTDTDLNIIYSGFADFSTQYSSVLTFTDNVATFDFNSVEPNYFKLENNSDTYSASIKSMTIVYSCVNIHETTTLTVTSDNESAGTVSYTQKSTYNVGESVTVTVTTNLGYNFDGWYENDVLVSTSESFTFRAGTYTNLVAKFSTDPAMSDFTFTSTTTTCEIDAIVDDSVTSITIPDYVTSIGAGAFQYCSSLTTINGGNGVTSIGNGAFIYCTSLTSIDLPNSVLTIGDSAFFFCSSLATVTIGSGVASIGSAVFAACSSLTNITVDSNNQYYQSIDDHLYSKDGTTLVHYSTAQTSTSFTIPSGVTTIEDYCFYSCTSLTSIVIPTSVTTIYDYAFCLCSNLANVYYMGTEDQWNAISFGENYSNLATMSGVTMTYNYSV